MPMVIKYGGNAMTDAKARMAVATAIRELADSGQQPVVVHGGGPFIRAALDAAGLEHRFERGLRVTTEASMPVIERTLTMLGKELAHEIGRAVGLTGRDARLLGARRLAPELGLVGTVERVQTDLLEQLLAARFTPVIACVACEENEGRNEAGERGEVLNVNADDVAAAVAGALRAPVIFLTNVPGVLDDPAEPASLLPILDRAEVSARIADGRIHGGMIPKVEAALLALERGASYALIADGRSAAAVAAAVGEQRGTRIVTGVSPSV